MEASAGRVGKALPSLLLHLIGRSWLRVALLALIVASYVAIGIMDSWYPGFLPGHNLVFVDQRNEACWASNGFDGMPVPGCTIEYYADGHLFWRYANGQRVEVKPHDRRPGHSFNPH